MYNPIIHNKIKLLGIVMEDIKALEIHLGHVSDPVLIMEYGQDMNALRKELNAVSSRCVILLEAYMEDCKTSNEPILLDYARVLKELRLAMRVI